MAQQLITIGVACLSVALSASVLKVFVRAHKISKDKQVMMVKYTFDKK